MYFDRVSGDDVWMVELDLSGAVGAGPRRRRSAAERRRVVEETLEVGASVAKVALKYGVNANQVFQWRRLYRDGKLGVSPSNTMKLLPVSVVEVKETPSQVPADVACMSSGAIRIELPGEIRISLEGRVDQDLLRTVLKSLRA
jgi:transposase